VSLARGGVIRVWGMGQPQLPGSEGWRFPEGQSTAVNRPGSLAQTGGRAATYSLTSPHWRYGSAIRSRGVYRGDATLMCVGCNLNNPRDSADSPGMIACPNEQLFSFSSASIYVRARAGGLHQS